ncbi:chymotrypsin-elastase inhibitor ixodidin [Drosophila grimshawi]|uniref:GH11993 n=1 Tax=Drosophila grimshawi TaxID=7222 RepID=B4JKU1_DROGR|nr:chymotrypsin-elastase inhibitor ixodidin [Drosophila grimshawi]EDW00194.1 GH11993 [Drosophila grimshawi]
MSGWKLLVIGCLLLQLALASAQPPITPRTCGINETYLPCGPSCQTECATLGQPCLINHIRCPDGCYCNKNYARNASGTCIPQAQCKKRVK